MDEPAGQLAIMEVITVDPHKEAIDCVTGPEAVHPQRHLVGAVSQPLVDPACNSKGKWKPNVSRG